MRNPAKACIAVFFIAAIGVCCSATAQRPPAAATDQNGDIEPEVTGIGARISVGGQRYIAIHRQNRNQALGTPALRYFHRPLFILQANRTPIAGYPDIVIAPPIVRGGKTYLTFRLILTTDKFQEDARAFVIANDPELKAPGRNEDLNMIRVDVWPIVKLTVKVTDPLTGQILGQWLSPDLKAAKPVIDVPIGFDDQALGLFKQLAPAGQVQFEFTYTFKNVRQQYAAAVSRASREVNQALQSAVRSQNLSSDRPIFQDQADQFRSALATTLVTEISASSAELIPLVQTQLLDKYLTQQTISIDKVSDPKLQDAIYGYLKPLIETAAEKRTKEDKTTTSHEEGVNVKLGASQGPANFEISKTDKDTISRTAGVTFEQSKIDQTYKPADIQVYKLARLNDEATVDITTRAFVAQGGDPTFQEDTPISASFTDTNLGGFPAAERTPNFDGVLPGMAFCFFGKTVPLGYGELDQSKTWPDAAWVPEHLRGKTMPAVQDLLVGVTRKVEDLGTLWTAGVIPLGDVNVPATGLSLTAATDDNRLIHTSVTFFPSCPRGAGPCPPRPMKPGETIVMAGGQNGGSNLQYVLAREAAATGIGGNATAKIPPVALNTSNTNPPNIRCRLIIKQ